MRTKKAIRAQRRRDRKMQKSKPDGYLRKIIRFLKQNLTWTIITAILSVGSIVLGIMTYRYSLSKDKKEIKLFLGDCEIPDVSDSALLYFYPTSEVGLSEISGILPLRFVNMLGNSVDEFYAELITSRYNIWNQTAQEERKDVIKMVSTNNFQKPRFVEELNVRDAQRIHFFEDKYEFARYSLPILGSQMNYNTYEEFRIDTTLVNHGPDSIDNSNISVVKDLFWVIARYGFRDIKKPSESKLNIAVVNMHSLDELVSFVEKEGLFPYFIPSTKTSDYERKYSIFVAIPQIIYDAKENSYNVDPFNISIYRVEYTNKSFYYNRTLTIYKNGKKVVHNLPDLDKTVPNREEMDDNNRKRG